MSNNIEALIAEMKAAAEKATPGEWWADVVETGGSHGNGEDCMEGFNSYSVYDQNNHSLLDMTNSTAAVITVEDDGDYVTAWDDVARRNAEFIALVNPSNTLALIAALEQSEKLKETFRVQSNMFCADANELKARVEDLESQRKMAFMASNRQADKFRGAEKRIAELESTLEREREKSRRVMSRNHQLKAIQLAVKLPRLAAVMWHLSAQAKRRTTAENVSDVLEALRAAGITVQGDE